MRARAAGRRGRAPAHRTSSVRACGQRLHRNRRQPVQELPSVGQWQQVGVGERQATRPAPCARASRTKAAQGPLVDVLRDELPDEDPRQPGGGTAEPEVLVGVVRPRKSSPTMPTRRASSRRKRHVARPEVGQDVRLTVSSDGTTPRTPGCRGTSRTGPARRAAGSGGHVAEHDAGSPSAWTRACPSARPGAGEDVVVEEQHHVASRVLEAGLPRGALAPVLPPHRAERGCARRGPRSSSIDPSSTPSTTTRTSWAPLVSSGGIARRQRSRRL